MNAHNPYAPSAATLQIDPHGVPQASDADVWREGNVLVMRPDANLPPRCVKCNEPCEFPMRPRNVYWHHWGVYLVLLFNIIIYVIVAMAARRKAIVAPGLCKEHSKKRRISIAIAWIVLLFSILALFMSVGSNEASGIWALMFAALLIGAIAFGMIRGRIVWAKHVSKEYTRLKGCGPAFLNSLPKFPG